MLGYSVDARRQLQLQPNAVSFTTNHSRFYRLHFIIPSHEPIARLRIEVDVTFVGTMRYPAFNYQITSNTDRIKPQVIEFIRHVI